MVSKKEIKRKSPIEILDEELLGEKKLLEEEKEKITNIMQEVLKSTEISESRPIKPLRFGNFYVYEVPVKIAGRITWRVFILPAPWEKVFKFYQTDVYHKGWYVKARVADVWLVYIGHIFSPRAGETIPMFLVVVSDWHARNSISIEKLKESGSTDSKVFEGISKKLDAYHSHELFITLREVFRNYEIYRRKYEELSVDIDKLADERAADVFIDLTKAIEAVQRRLESPQSMAVSVVKWLILATAAILGIVGIFMLIKFLGIL